MTKRELRVMYREKRRSLQPGEKDKLEDLMLIRFQEAGWQVPDTVMTYIPFSQENEYDPELVIRYCRFQHPGLRLCCPLLLNQGNRMDAVSWDEDTVFARNSFGIPEPVNSERVDGGEIGMVLVPLLAYDLHGYRVGFGKGYYDRFLAEQCPQATRIGFSFFEPVDSVDDVESYDMPLDFCVTPVKLYSFNH